MSQSIKIMKTRYGDAELNPRSTKGQPKRRGRPTKEESKRRQLTEAKQAALEKARAVLIEKRRKEREAKKRLKEQDNAVDQAILLQAQRGRELREQLAEKKRIQDEARKAREEQEAIEREAMEQAQAEYDAWLRSTEDAEPADEPVNEPQEEVVYSQSTDYETDYEDEDEDEEEEPADEPADEPRRTRYEQDAQDVVKRIGKPNQKGKRVLVIDSSIFEDEEEPEIEYKRKPKPTRTKRPPKVVKPVKEPRRKADRRTRFSQQDEVYEYDTHEPVDEPDDDDYGNEYDAYRQDNRRITIDNKKSTSQPVHAPPPAIPQLSSRSELELQDPLYSMIFG